MVDATAHRVGAALAYLVVRMETFCGVSDTCVLVYKRDDVGGIPRRMPAADVLRGQARHYPVHRHLYPDDHRELLDTHVSIVGEPDGVAIAVEGFTAELTLTRESD